MKKIDTNDWKEFVIKDLFDVSRPTARSQANYDEGDVPFVASGNYNNGVLKYLEPKKDEVLDKGNCITVSPIDGSAFYQEVDFLGRGGAGSSIIILRNENLNLYNGMYIATVIRAVCSKYVYNDMANKDTIGSEKIRLPIDKEGNPNFSYMESYMKNLGVAVSSSLNALQSAKKNCKPKMVDMSKWKEYKIGDIFSNIQKPHVYHTKHVVEDSSGIPYVVRSKFNNGIKYYVKKPLGKINPPNVISFGAENATFFYQEMEWVSGRDIYYIDTQGLSRNICLFFTACLQPIASKYSYNNGLFPKLLKEEKIKLPSLSNGDLDYDFMENYMNNLIESSEGMIRDLSLAV